ncbi:TetR/AcrR family transcriptional regulator [Peribacillus frigoritolerans]|uniref:TetR/AcrR family transcriptional regulator n=1 Tax=Peribacillus frigoritolerans TaxID=450367 RepID=UPI002B2555E5|nr:TetR/AcrR family transcriptional regulator [Peribacillus frigoritolerans]MEB2494571.1 TetR/AcrR family transcriptional regulator [Peribacillus frigoritolerans]
MAETKIDPRIIRTRRLIMDAFIQLSMSKDFKDITIKDITTEATVNRATFYYHFTDKYDLLEKVLKEDLMTNVIREIAEYDQLNEVTIVSVFLSVTKFQMSLATQCRRSFESFTTTIETIIKKELESIFYQLLLKQHAIEGNESLRIAAVMLSWGIYGTSVDWQHNSTMPPEDYIKLAIPYVTHGMDFLVSEEL